MRYSEITEALRVTPMGRPLPEIGTYVKDITDVEEEEWLVCAYIQRLPFDRTFTSKEKAASARKPELFCVTPENDSFTGFITIKPQDVVIVRACGHELGEELRTLAAEFKGEGTTHAAMSEYAELVHELYRRMPVNETLKPTSASVDNPVPPLGTIIKCEGDLHQLVVAAYCKKRDVHGIERNFVCQRAEADTFLTVHVPHTQKLDGYMVGTGSDWKVTGSLNAFLTQRLVKEWEQALGGAMTSALGRKFALLLHPMMPR